MCLTHLARLDPANPQLEMDPPEGMDSSEQHSSSSSSNGVEAPGPLSSSEKDAAKTEVVTSDGLTDKVLQGGDMMNLEASLDAEVAAAEAEAEALEAVAKAQAAAAAKQLGQLACLLLNLPLQGGERYNDAVSPAQETVHMLLVGGPRLRRALGHDMRAGVGEAERAEW